MEYSHENLQVDFLDFFFFGGGGGVPPPFFFLKGYGFSAVLVIKRISFLAFFFFLGGGGRFTTPDHIKLLYFDGRQLNLLISMMDVLFVFCFLLSRITFLLLVIMLFVLGVFSNNEPFPTFSNVCPQCSNA